MGLQVKRGLLGLVLALLVPAAGFAQPPVAVTGVDPVTGLTAAALADAVTNSLRVTITETFTPLFTRPVPLAGSFGRTIGSHGDALNVNLRYPAASYDPCMGTAPKSNQPISQTANTKIIFGAGAGKRVHICAIFVLVADAENISLVEGTGATCGTGTAAIIGGTTAATGPNLTAGSGWTHGNGAGTIAHTTNPANDVCLLMSGSGRTSGNIVYAYGPMTGLVVQQ